MPENLSVQIEELQRELREVRRDLYGNPQVRQAGVFDRLEGIEQRVSELKLTYERERIEKDNFEQLESQVSQIMLDFKVMMIYIKGIVGGVSALFIALVSAIVAGVLKYWSE